MIRETWDKASEFAHKLSTVYGYTVEIGEEDDKWTASITHDTDRDFEKTVHFKTEKELASWLEGVYDGIHMHLVLLS